MATSVIDVRDTFAPAPARAPQAVAASPTTVRRLPLAVIGAGAVGITEAVALLAVGLTGLDGVLTSASRPSGALIALALIALAGWIVLAAAGGAALIDGTGKKLSVAVSYGELGLVGMLAVVAVGAPVPVPFGLPLPAALLLLLAVPVGKLLLVGAPSAQAWIAAGPRTRERRPDPVAAHRGAATLTLAAIGLGLVVLTVSNPVPEGGPASPLSSTVYQP